MGKLLQQLVRRGAADFAVGRYVIRCQHLGVTAMLDFDVDMTSSRFACDLS